MDKIWWIFKLSKKIIQGNNLTIANKYCLSIINAINDLDNNLNDINENIIIENDIESKNSSNDMESIINEIYELNINDEDNYNVNNEVNELMKWIILLIIIILMKWIILYL